MKQAVESSTRWWGGLGVVLLAFWGAGVAQGGPSGPVTWGSTVTIGGGWGRMAQLPNGHWLCVTTRFPAGTNSYLRVLRSTNQCRTWTVLSELTEADRTLDNGELIVLPNGEVLLTMRSLVPNVSYRLPVYASTNQGLAWTYRSNIDTSEGAGAAAGRGLWEPDFWVLDDGRLVVTYSNEKHNGYSQLISLKVSTDDGVTWGSETWAVAQPGGGNLRPGMSQMARMANGQYILVYEVVNSGNADVHAKISTDGVNWPTGLGRKIPCQHCGPFVTSLPNGILLVSSCENQVSFSEDFGETWEKIDPPAWPGGFVWTWPAIYSIQANEVGVMVVTNGVRMRFGAVSPRPNWPNPLVETFDAATDAGWSRYGGNVAFDSGAYVLNNAGTNGKAMFGDGFWRDGVLEADMMVQTPGNAGLMFRTTNPDYTGPDDAMGYYVGLDTAGSVLLGRMSNAWTFLTNRPVTVSTNVWYRLGVAMQGSQITVSVDGVPRFSRTDTHFTRGQIGVRAFQCNARFDKINFSNATPLRLTINREEMQSQLVWPETSVRVKLHAGPGLTGGVLLTNAPAPSNGFHRLELERTAGTEYYWLQAE